MRKAETIRQLEEALAACQRAWRKTRKFYPRQGGQGTTIRLGRAKDHWVREKRWDQRCGRYAQRAVVIQGQLAELREG